MQKLSGKGNEGVLAPGDFRAEELVVDWLAAVDTLLCQELLENLEVYRVLEQAPVSQQNGAAGRIARIRSARSTRRRMRRERG